MENDRNYKVVAVVVLILAIIGLTVGFAAFSTALNISSSQSSVRPDETAFNVSFSSSETTFAEDEIVGVVSDSALMTATNAVIDNSNYKNPVIRNLSAKFTGPGQTVSYTFYSHNRGNYDAYLKSISFQNIDGKTENKVCAPISSSTEGENVATDSLVQAACEDISIKVDIVGEKSQTATDSVLLIKDHILARDSSEKIVITMTYGNSADASTRADGDFTVDFGSIVLNYGSVDNA